MLIPNELILTSGGFYLCATFGKKFNQSRNAIVRVHSLTHTNSLLLYLCATQRYNNGLLDVVIFSRKVACLCAGGFLSVVVFIFVLCLIVTSATC